MKKTTLTKNQRNLLEEMVNSSILPSLFENMEIDADENPAAFNEALQFIINKLKAETER